MYLESATQGTTVPQQQYEQTQPMVLQGTGVPQVIIARSAQAPHNNVNLDFSLTLLVTQLLVTATHVLKVSTVTIMH